MRKKVKQIWVGEQIIVVLMLIAFIFVSTATFAYEPLICVEANIVTNNQCSSEL